MAPLKEEAEGLILQADVSGTFLVVDVMYFKSIVIHHLGIGDSSRCRTGLDAPRPAKAQTSRLTPGAVAAACLPPQDRVPWWGS